MGKVFVMVSLSIEDFAWKKGVIPRLFGTMRHDEY